MPSDAQFHVNMTARVARAAHAKLMKDPFATLYVYYRARMLETFEDINAGQSTYLGLPTPADDGWTLAFPERVPSSLSADQLVAWFAARTGRVPYLTDEGA